MVNTTKSKAFSSRLIIITTTATAAIIAYLKCDIVVTGSPGFVSLCVFIFLTASSK
jgi:hypothetical protein